MKKKEKMILNSKVRDSGGKKIFEDPLLCVQFLRDYISDIPCFQDVRPDDIEDVSGLYVPLFSEERNSDSVKRIHINNNEEPFFIISLIEHKSYVEYNVCMQIFRYMVYIWESYEKEMDARHKGISHSKDFRYPPILPIVYYEGSGKWDVPLDFQSRIFHGELFSEYLLNFRYYLVQLNEYSNGELLDKNDEISLVMMINKLQSLEDIKKFKDIPTEKMQEIISDSPDRVVKIIADILLALLLKINVPAEKAEDIVGKVREKRMGLLFENFEPVDVQELRKKLDIDTAKYQRANESLQNKIKDFQNKKRDFRKKEKDFQNKEKDFQNKEKELQKEREKLKAEQEKFRIEVENFMKEKEKYKQ